LRHFQIGADTVPLAGNFHSIWKKFWILFVRFCVDMYLNTCFVGSNICLLLLPFSVFSIIFLDYNFWLFSISTTLFCVVCCLGVCRLLFAQYMEPFPYRWFVCM
jgi:hypothetical protein